MRSRRTAALIALMVIGVACGGGGGGGGGTPSSNATEGTTAATNLKVAFVYDGAIDDGGWNTSHHAGEQYLVKHLPGVQVTELENISPGDKARATFQDLGTQGYQLVVGTTYYQDDMEAVANDYPDTVFLNWGGDKTAANIGQFNLATEDGRYLDGIVAGSMTKDNIIGYVGGYPIPEVIRGINAFILGAQTVNPKVKVIPLMVNSWYDPAKERDAAQSLVDQGADVLGHEMNSPAVPSVAERNGAYVVGYGWNQEARSPKYWLSSFIFNWGPYYLQQAQAVADGKWKPSVYYGGLAQDGITMSPFGPDVPKTVVDLVNKDEAAIKSGSLDVLAGPIEDNKGNTVVAAGKTIPVADRPNCCDWYAAGVEGTVPKS